MFSIDTIIFSSKSISISDDEYINLFTESTFHESDVERQIRGIDGLDLTRTANYSGGQEAEWEKQFGKISTRQKEK